MRKTVAVIGLGLYRAVPASANLRAHAWPHDELRRKVTNLLQWSLQ